ncbi:hypothetical protein CH300_10235 [Rhodococcus sp. 15-1154-1]|nr:flavodoxin domain-containing protein [Rhodococcus sp. 15-1154-1]OZF06423.1 hypothetical protein CH300_10235 [Rhodococcus sp. 15-1154-1]
MIDHSAHSEDRTDIVDSSESVSSEPKTLGVLVLYASSGGSTRGVAEHIAQRLRSNGERVEVRSTTDPLPPPRHDALVIGSAVHNGQWLPAAEEAVDYVVADSDRCAKVWAFSVSTVGASSSLLASRLAAFLRPRTPEPTAVQNLRRYTGLQDHRSFAGCISPGDWPGVGRVVFRLMGGRYGDARDWNDIEQWASRIDASIHSSP